MPIDKDFKRLVRARMRRTGESYTAARAQLRPTEDAAGPPQARRTEGVDPDATAVRSVLAALGVPRPDTGEPFDEPLLFALGGGIGVAYFVFRYEAEGFTSVYVGGRMNPFVLGREVTEVTAERAGLTTTVQTTTSARKAEAALRDALSAGRAAIVVVDRGALPDAPVPVAAGLDTAGMAPHPLAVVGETPGGPVVRGVGEGAAPLSWSWAQLAEARARVPSAKHRMTTLERGDGDGLPAAVHAGLADTSRGLLDPPRTNFGLAGLERWRDDLRGRGPRGWRRLLADPDDLEVALAWAAYWIEAADTGGGACRPLFAAACDEAAVILDVPGLGEVATAYRELGPRWTSLASAALDADTAAVDATCDALADRVGDLLDAETEAATALRDHLS